MPTIRPAGVDYDAEEALVLDEPAKIRVLFDDTRTAICSLLRDRAWSVQQLSRELGLPKGTVGHHVKVLEEAGLIQVVRTRQVRAVTEKFYGRIAWIFVLKADDAGDDAAFGAAGLRRAAAEMEQAPEVFAFGLVRARLLPADQRRLDRRLHKLMDDIAAADSEEGQPCVLAAALYSRPPTTDARSRS